jgi:hypothetical protein
MGSLLQCLFRICCDSQDEGEWQRRHHHEYSAVPPASARMSRAAAQHDSLVAEEEARSEGGGLGEPRDAAAADCCHPSESGTVASSGSTTCGDAAAADPHTQGIHAFFRHLRERWRQHAAFEAVRGGQAATGDHYGLLRQTGSTDISERNKIPPSPVLRQASSFDSSRDIPCINPEEIVLPGSLLQKEMAMKMSESLEAQNDECVICMEGFDPTNPRMPTLCGCGENKTYFHLPCLYQWIEQSRDCPSCRKRLRWEEF